MFCRSWVVGAPCLPLKFGRNFLGLICANSVPGGIIPGGACLVLSACVQRIISLRSGTRSRVTRRAMVACLVLPTCWGSP